MKRTLVALAVGLALAACASENGNRIGEADREYIPDAYERMVERAARRGDCALLQHMFDSPQAGDNTDLLFFIKDEAKAAGCPSFQF